MIFWYFLRCYTLIGIASLRFQARKRAASGLPAAPPPLMGTPGLPGQPAGQPSLLGAPPSLPLQQPTTTQPPSGAPDAGASAGGAEDESGRKRRKKSRWGGGDTEKTFIPGMPTMLPSGLSKDQEEAYLRKSRGAGGGGVKLPRAGRWRVNFLSLALVRAVRSEMDSFLRSSCPRSRGFLKVNRLLSI